MSESQSKRRGFLERLDAGELLIGDGGFVVELEKRGYVKAGPWTPEACVEHPEAVRQLHREFLRAGSDIMQAFTFYASDDKLENRGNDACSKHGGANINRAACHLAREVAQEGDALFLGGVCETPTYLSGVGEEATKNIFRKQMKVFQEEKVDLILCEYFEYVEEAVWAAECAQELSMPVGVNMCIGPKGDMHGISAAACAVRLAAAGVRLLGVNCHFDPFVSLQTMQLMIDGVKAAMASGELSCEKAPHYMVQPLAFMTPDAGVQGFIDLPEFPFALEPRICTRFEMAKFARQAYDMGIRVIGGCCGFQAYHIRAIAEELAEEHGRVPEGAHKHLPWGGGLRMHTKPWVRARARREYWEKLEPATGRPFSASHSVPDQWGLTAGDAMLQQKKEETTNDELEKVFELAK